MNAERSRELRLLSVNLWNGRAEPAALDEVLDRLRPDVVVAQELADNAAAVLARHFPRHSLSPRSDTFGMGIAARGSARFRALPMPRRTFLAAEVEVPEQAVTNTQPLCIDVVNVHLSCPEAPSRVWERTVQVRRLLALQRRAPGPRVLAGDFNSAPPMPAYLALCTRFTDAAWQVTRQQPDWRRRWDSLPARTWGPTASAPRLARIDHVMVAKLRVTRLVPVPVRGSDHDGLFASIVAERTGMSEAGS